MEQTSPLPDRSRLSILISTVLLAYTLTHFVSIPVLELDFSILGVFFPIRINFTTLVSLLVAGLTASGTAWLLQEHPRKPQGATFVHWLLPSLTALVLLQAINLLPFSGAWWVAALGSGGLLLLVLAAEYIVIDSQHGYFTPAELGITALSIVLFLILSISLHSAEARLFYRVPVLSLAALLVYLRVIHLRQGGNWALVAGSAAFLLIGELAAALHYWPLGSIAYGIALTGPLFALVEISDLLPGQTDQFQPRALWGPILIILLSWAAALAI